MKGLVVVLPLVVVPHLLPDHLLVQVVVLLPAVQVVVLLLVKAQLLHLHATALITILNVEAVVLLPV